MESASLDRVTITGGGTGKGVVMEGKKMEMSGGEISKVELGVYATGTGMTMTGVNISNVDKGVLIKGTGMLTMNKGEITF
ncbi:hypothetical protein, partial [Bartonella bovis]|uniref:hypothetical protein n=1 Tax=Bartonella bovis TaxID=155194 RepID=UPI00195819D6